MSLQFTAAPSSRIRKPSSLQASRRGLPFARHARTKPSSAAASRGCALKHGDSVRTGDDENYGQFSYETRLSDIGSSSYISETTLVRNVVQAIQHVQNTTFASLPETRAGMNSTRIAEVLNFRRSLPPIVSVAHVHLLLNDPTRVEREILGLVEVGRLRRLIIPGRMGGAAALGDCLVLVEDWEECIRRHSSLSYSLKEKFVRVLRSNTKVTALPATTFSQEESSALVRAGFLISRSSLSDHNGLNTSSPARLVRGSSGRAIADKGATLATRAFDGHNHLSPDDGNMLLSVPNMGPHLRLLGAARSHLLALLEKSKYREAPLYLLRDRWDGAVESDSHYSLAKRARGQSTGVMPGRTKKWKELYGMNFRWVLEEVLGAGLVELFDTGSVGPGVRRV